ncbi:MAG: hypothetical protein PHF57_03475, partial [Methanoregula sp.]|nr:hypothetical protein [Methanoregula sp.]
MVSWAVASGAYPAAPEPAKKPVRTGFDRKRWLARGGGRVKKISICHNYQNTVASQIRKEFLFYFFIR